MFGACALPLAAAWRVGVQQAGDAQQRLCGGHGGSCAAAWLGDAARWCGQQGHRALQRVCAGALSQWYCPRGNLVLTVYMHTGAGLTQENWQILNTIGQWLTSQALPFIIGGDFQVEPSQLEDSGWVRAVGGYVVAPRLATITPSHRVIDFFVVSRDLAGACEATTHISQHIAPHRPVKIFVSTRMIQLKKRVMSRPQPWPQVRPSGCRRAECDFDWDAVRQRVQASERPQEGWATFIDAVEEDFIDIFLIAPDVAEAYRGRSHYQRLVWKACKSPWCDKFPRGTHEMQAWRRKACICGHILTARQRLDEDAAWRVPF